MCSYSRPETSNDAGRFCLTDRSNKGETEHAIDAMRGSESFGPRTVALQRHSIGRDRFDRDKTNTAWVAMESQHGDCSQRVRPRHRVGRVALFGTRASQFFSSSDHRGGYASSGSINYVPVTVPEKNREKPTRNSQPGGSSTDPTAAHSIEQFSYSATSHLATLTKMNSWGQYVGSLTVTRRGGKQFPLSRRVPRLRKPRTTWLARPQTRCILSPDDPFRTKNRLSPSSVTKFLEGHRQS